MKASKLLVYGTETTNDLSDSTERFTIQKTILVNQVFRDAQAKPIEIVVDDDQIYEYHFDDDTVWLSDPGSIDEVFPGATPQTRGLAEEGTIVLPLALSPNSDLGRAIDGKKILLKVIKVFTRNKVKKIIAAIVREKAEMLEHKVLFEKGGLFRVDRAFQLTKTAITAEARALLFLHGTASSTKGSFESLSEKRGGGAASTWELLHELFPERVFAFEHRSLTQSPLENVRDLVEALPDGVTLHLIAQSRGGMIGDLLCRFVAASQQNADPFSKIELDYLKKSEREDDIALIQAIQQALAGKTIRVEKFIRVACPAGGSTLASKRLDNWLNVLFNIGGYAAGGVVGPVVAAFKELVMAAVETKDDPDVLPGLAPQNPESALCKVINNTQSEVVIDVPMAIISGDNQFTFKWRGLVNIVSNLFFLAQNDFVVNTRSMYKGPKRAPGKTVYFMDKGGEVTHFNYFRNETTRTALSNAISASGNNVPGFTTLPESMVESADLRNISITISNGVLSPVPVSRNRPILVLLPGIMGSNLSHDGSLLWLNFAKFVGGGLENLRYSEDNNRSIRADSVVGNSYSKLYKYLSSEYDVLVYPFDWRMDMRSNVDQLNETLLALMEHGQTLKIVGHSMGGVLVRDLMALYPGTLAKLHEIPGFRILFLGSPLQGSFRIASVLFGEDELIKLLATIDFKNTKKDLLKIFVRFPGILGLLPHTTGNGNDFGQLMTWKNMRQAYGDENWPIPDTTLLQQFADHRNDILATRAAIDYSKATYIAGTAARGKRTVSGYRIEPRSFLFSERLTLRFEETLRGDGSVTWDSGIPAKMIEDKSVFYSNVTHGELANDESLFLAISEVLKTGDTVLLSKQEPTVATRSVEGDPQPVTRGLVTYELDDSKEGLMSSVLGLYPAEQRAATSRIPLQVSVTHGDLRYAKNPILVGHFANDGIWSAEKAADKHLNFELSRRRKLGLYPGPVGTNLMVTPVGDSLFPGVIVVGLGIQGEYNERVLQSSIEQAVKQYLVSLIHTDNTLAASALGEEAEEHDSLLTNDSDPKSVGLSSLLIGSNYGGLPLDRALTAIMSGIQNANAEIRLNYPSDFRQVSELELIELYQDQALAASRTLRAMERQEESRILFVRMDRRIREAMGRQQRVNLGYSSGWWSRVMVRRYHDDDNVSEQRRAGLYFGVSTDAARVEERSLQTAGTEVLSMLKEVSENSNWSPELAKTLFELLIPNDFKSLIKRQGNLIWQLDEYTAGFPWELLQDNLENGKPLSINCGMIRQLSSQNFRIQVKMATENNVLVIADPNLKGKFYQLPNAAAEGGRVSQQLQSGGFSVQSDIGGSSDSILRKMYVRPYKVLHIAAHGVFEFGDSKATGVVIGPESFLTPAHINQMSETPELVFINCCYLGKTDLQAEHFAQNRYRLAANIGTQLINDGVKAVIVAGWPVGDRAALLFASNFYEGMLRGELFGEAVLKARRQVYERFGSDDNTWGAYQCYGDPSYVLKSKKISGLATEDTEFETEEVLVMELTNLLNDLDLAQVTEQKLSRIAAIESSLSASQRSSGRVIELLAQVYVALGNLKKAIEHYESLKSFSNAKYSLRSLEQLCNLKVKYSMQKWRSNPSDLSETQRVINDAIVELNRLQAISPTSERFNLLASCYKRLAMIEQAPDLKKENYQKTAQYYREASGLIPSHEMFYPLANASLIDFVLEGSTQTKKKKGTLSESTNTLVKEYERIRKKATNKDDYWSQVALCELPLYLWLIEGREANTQRLLALAESIKKHSGHLSNWAAIAEQLYFLEDLFGLLENSKEKEKKLAMIRQVRERVG